MHVSDARTDQGCSQQRVSPAAARRSGGATPLGRRHTAAAPVAAVAAAALRAIAAWALRGPCAAAVGVAASRSARGRLRGHPMHIAPACPQALFRERVAQPRACGDSPGGPLAAHQVTFRAAWSKQHNYSAAG